MIHLSLSFDLCRDKDNDFWLVFDSDPLFMARDPHNCALDDGGLQPVRWRSYSWDNQYAPLESVTRLEFLLATGEDAIALFRRDKGLPLQTIGEDNG